MGEIKMETVKVNLGERSYNILITTGGIEKAGAELKSVIPDEKVLVISDSRVGPLYSEKVLESLRQADFDADDFIFNEGEDQKILFTVERIYSFLAEYNYPRQCTLAALGGGVTGDLTGFAAATYMRGVNFVQIPTTLLAMVDSSVGGKTGVNHRLSKNLIGAFYQPRLVFIDTDVLKTLAPEEFRSGLAEVIKYGMIADPELFLTLEDETGNLIAGNSSSLERIIKRCCEIKAEIVSRDERESGVRAILNFGHTVGHAIEALTNYHKYRHGEAVAIGMIAAARIAVKIGMLDDMQSQRLWNLLKQAKLPYRFSALDPADIIERMKKDKKVRSGRIRLVLPKKIGEVEIRDDVPEKTLLEVLEEMQGEK